MMNNYTPYEYKRKTLLIEKYIILNERECDLQEFDIFSLELDNQVKELIARGINLNDYTIFEDLDRELFNSFRYIENSQNRKYLLYTQVYSKTNAKIIISITAAKAKLWVNGKCISLHPDNYPASYFLTCDLNKGVNHIVFEQFCVEKESRFSIQIRDYEYEMQDNFDSLSQILHSMQLDPFVLAHDHFYCPTEDKFRFMYFKNNNSEFNQEFEIELLDSEIGVIRTLYGKLNEAYKIDLCELRELSEETVRHERLLCRMIDSQNNLTKKYFCVFLKNYEERAEQIKSELLSAARKQSVDIYTRACAEIENLNRSLSNKNYVIAYWDLHRCFDLLSDVNNRTLEKYSYKQPGTHQVYIQSKLDGTYVKIGVRVPSGYNEINKYPVFVAISSSNEGSFCQGFPPESVIEEKCLCFDVTGRGYTAGSYLGQASILEILDWIKANFSIDEDRLYFVGYSNGGYAAYALAQNFPHLCAAIYPLAGYPQIDTIKNISNIPTYQIISPKDYVFAGRENEVNNVIKRYRNYNQYTIKEMKHVHFPLYLYHKKVLNEMLRHTRNPYPKTVYYKTFRNRNLKSFWIELHGIAKGKTSGKIKAEIIDSETIKLTASDITGVTVTIPPQINRSRFDIIINRKKFSFTDFGDENVMLEKNKSWKIIEEIEDLQEKDADVCKGTGLLDVYLGKLKVLLPENPSEILVDVANRFSRPYTNGYSSFVWADYQIYTEENIPEHIFDNNLILLDACNKNNFVKQFEDTLPVSYNLSGFTYQGEFHKKDYVVMQVVPNPYNKNMSILVVSTNNEELLQRHILLRRVMLPTYINNIHPLWNNEILIFDGKEYSAVYEFEIKCLALGLYS